jgi:nanoRNase/pAp phosphatase (c-di-AMP/oligoRNAs hydrolase)
MCVCRAMLGNATIRMDCLWGGGGHTQGGGAKAEAIEEEEEGQARVAMCLVSFQRVTSSLL